MSLILASNSEIRQRMLSQAGIEFRVISPDYDEVPVKQGYLGDGANLARQLAEGKSLSLADVREDWVIGSDSVVSVGGRFFSKPNDLSEAKTHLLAFSGRPMLLSSAAALSRNGRVKWSHAETAHLHVRVLSEAFIDSYLDSEWPAISFCAGAFRLEGRGVTLFESFEGSYFTILGMPLLPLLGALRMRGVLPS